MAISRVSSSVLAGIVFKMSRDRTFISRAELDMSVSVEQKLFGIMGQSSVEPELNVIASAWQNWLSSRFEDLQINSHFE